MPFITLSEGGSLYYEIQGVGAPLLMIHGFMGTGMSEFPDLAPRLAERYQVILPDLRGYGRSEPKPRRYGVDFYERDAQDVLALLEALNLRDVSVMGYSDGGEVALCLGVLAAERLRCILTWGAIGHFDPIMRPHILAMLNMSWRNTEMDQLHGAQYIPDMARYWVQSMLAMIDTGGDITYSQAAKITCPTRIILGEQDRLNPSERGRSMAAAIPKGHLSLYKKTGHAVHSEQPVRFWRETSRFLKNPR